MKTFLLQGAETRNWTVAVDDPERGRHYSLPEYFALCNHSPDGFAWGYGGSGPSQLAFALLYNVTLDEELTRRLYMQFKNKVIAPLDMYKNWTLTEEDIRDWVNKNS